MCRAVLQTRCVPLFSSLLPFQRDSLAVFRYHAPSSSARRCGPSIRHAPAAQSRARPSTWWTLAIHPRVRRRLTRAAPFGSVHQREPPSGGQSWSRLHGRGTPVAASLPHPDPALKAYQFDIVLFSSCLRQQHPQTRVFVLPLLVRGHRRSKGFFAVAKLSPCIRIVSAGGLSSRWAFSSRKPPPKRLRPRPRRWLMIQAHPAKRKQRPEPQALRLPTGGCIPVPVHPFVCESTRLPPAGYHPVRTTAPRRDSHPFQRSGRCENLASEGLHSHRCPG